MKILLPVLLFFGVTIKAWLPLGNNLLGNPSSTGPSDASTGRRREIRRPSGFPEGNKIRGVNLGSLFIFEPWMASSRWSSMGCADTKSEFDCVELLGQQAADSAFSQHWDTWITEADFDRMLEYGLNAVRVPLGYWILEDLVLTYSEYFPKGGLKFLDRVVGWAANRDMYVILDLHGAPGAQVKKQPFTGQYTSEVGFFDTIQYERAYRFLETITNRIHTNEAYRTTGMLEILNEPEQGHRSLVSEYYKSAYKRIRAVETHLNVPKKRQLTLQFMDEAWGAGNPKAALKDTHGIAFDKHRYLKWASVEHDKPSYLNISCSDKIGEDGKSPTIVGEWSLGVASGHAWDKEWNPTHTENKKWYRHWWAAQTIAYEQSLGWVFWSWKTGLDNDWRWSYSAAVEAGVISKSLNNISEIANC